MLYHPGMAEESAESAAPPRLYKPTITRLRNGDIYLLYATTDHKNTISLLFKDEDELREWLREAGEQAGV